MKLKHLSMSLSKLCLPVIIFLFLFGSTAKAQENDGPREKNDKTYIISDKGSVMDIQPYINALNTSNMQNHRLKNKRNTIVFQSGLKVELFSATELVANGWKINVADYPEEFQTTANTPVFGLGPNNYIMEYHKVATKHN
jgi:hypothetical protein